MITACHNCAFNGLGGLFSSFADRLPNGAPSTVKTNVERIRRYLLAKCRNCRRASQDDIRIQKTPHAKSEYMTVTPATQGGRCERKIAGTITPLDADNEGRLRLGMATLFGLSPIQLLLVQHLMRGGRLAKFGDTLRATHEQIGKYRGSERAQAGMMRDAILARAPMLAPVLAPCYSGGGTSPAVCGGGATRAGDKPRHNGAAGLAGGHAVVAGGGAKVDARPMASALDELPVGDLFELAGVEVPFDRLERKTRR